MLLHAISDGVGLLTWAQDSFGYADSFDETAGRYQGLRGGQNVMLVDAHAPGLVVKREQHNNQKALQRVIASYSVADVDERINLLNSAIKTDPDVFNGYNSLGYAYLEKHDTFGAIESFKEAIAHHPEAKEGYIDLAKAYIRVKRLDLARTYLGKAIIVDPDAQLDIENDIEVQQALRDGI